MPLQNCHFHSKLKADTIFTSMCLLGLTNRPEPVNYLYLIFTEFKKVSKTFVDAGVIQSDNCYLLFVTEYCKASPTSNYDKFYHKQRFRGLLFVVWFSFKIRFAVKVQVRAQCLLQLAISLRCPSSYEFSRFRPGR